MGARKYDYDADQARDYSDLSDNNQSALGRAQEKWGDAQVFDGGAKSNSEYDANSLANAERGAVSSSQTSNEGALAGSSAATENRFNYTGGGTHKSRDAKLKGAGKFLRNKKATLAGAATLVATSAGFMVTSFFGALAAPIHIMQTITDLKQFSGISTDKVINKFWGVKVKYAGTNCNSRSKVFCRFSTLSDKQIENLKKSGWEVETSGKATFGGNKVAEIKHTATGKIIPNDTNSIKNMMKDPELKGSWDKAYKGKFKTFLDSQSDKFKKWFNAKGVTANNKGKSTSELQEEQLNHANGGAATTGSSSKTGELSEDEKNNLDDPDADPSKAQKEAENILREEGKKLKGKSRAEKLAARANTVKNITDKAQKLTGVVNKLCSVFSTIALGVSALKLVSVEVLIRFGHTFLSMASKMKAGQATTEEVESIGNPTMGILTSSDKKDNNDGASIFERFFGYIASVNTDTTNSKSFSESQGWRAMAYNDNIGSLDNSAEKYAVGFIDKTVSVLNDVFNGKFGNFIKKTCKVMGYVGVAVSAANIAATALACVGTGGGACIASITKAVVESGLKQAALNLLLTTASQTAGQIVIEKAFDFITGDYLNASTVGEDYGNAVMAGAGAEMAKNATAGGASLLTKEQSLAWYFDNQKTLAENAEYERSILSPFDITSRNTFLGSIFFNTMPYHKSMATLGGTIPAIASIASGALASISPASHADDAAGFKANMNVCTDPSITQLGIGTDIFCNPYVGVDSGVAESADLEDAILQLIDAGELDDDDNTSDITSLAKGDFEKYIESCYNRSAPIGFAATEDGDDIGERCSPALYPRANLYAVVLTYFRIEGGLEVSEPSGSSGSSSSYSSAAKSSDCSAGDLCWPIEGANAGMITAGRWFHAGHNGYDFGAGGVTYGTPVYAVADGEIVVVGTSALPGVDYKTLGYGPNLNGDTGGCNFGYGNYGGGEHFVLIKHNINGKTYYSAYAHMQNNTRIFAGQKITAGEKVGEVGNYGCSFGAHLHFSVRTLVYGNEVDPKEMLGELK